MIPQCVPNINYEDILKRFRAYLTIENSPFLSEYKETVKFEQKIAKVLNVKHAICVNNGTISLSLGLKALNIKAGDKVAVPAISQIATANAITFIGAKLIFVDCDPVNGLMDADNLKETLLKHNIKAIIYVTFNGRSETLEKIQTYQEATQIPILIDAAQSFGSLYANKEITKKAKQGISSYSLSFSKIITTGQGGILTTNDSELAETIVRLKDFGRSTGGMDHHDYFGINSKFSDLQAIVGLSQISTIKDRIKAKKDIYQLYYKNLSFCMEELKDWETPWFIEVKIAKKQKQDFMKYLTDAGIQVRDMYIPMPYQKVYNKKRGYNKAQTFSDNYIWIPSSLTLTQGDVEYITKTIKEYHVI